MPDKLLHDRMGSMTCMSKTGKYKKTGEDYMHEKLVIVPKKKTGSKKC